MAALGHLCPRCAVSGGHLDEYACVTHLKYSINWFLVPFGPIDCRTASAGPAEHSKRRRHGIAAVYGADAGQNSRQAASGLTRQSEPSRRGLRPRIGDSTADRSYFLWLRCGAAVMRLSARLLNATGAVNATMAPTRDLLENGPIRLVALTPDTSST